MAAAVATADPDGAVPSCPEWTVRDLVRHMGGVHRWAAGFVTSGRTEPLDADLDEVVGTWPADADLAAWLGQGCADLVDALAAAPDDLQCWTFLPAPSPRAMWARRQAHETAIHRVDAELAAGATVTGFAAPFAADGTDELLRLFVPRRSTMLRADPPTTLGVRCADVDASWLLHLGSDGVHDDEGRPRRCGLHGDRHGRRSLPGVVEPRRRGRPDRRRRPRRAWAIRRGGADSLVLGRSSGTYAVGAVSSLRRPTSQ